MPSPTPAVMRRGCSDSSPEPESSGGAWGQATFSGSSVIVSLTGVANAKYVTVTLDEATALPAP